MKRFSGCQIEHIILFGNTIPFFDYLLVEPFDREYDPEVAIEEFETRQLEKLGLMEESGRKFYLVKRHGSCQISVFIGYSLAIVSSFRRRTFIEIAS